MQVEHEQVIGYFSRRESRLGYRLLLGGSQHMGFYPSRHAGISEAEAQRIYHDLVAERLGLCGGERLLDAGCGQGVVSSDLAARYDVKVDGVTIVPFEVEASRARAVRCGVSERVRYQQMDYAATSFAGATFDGIYVTESLSHSPEIERTLAEFFRVLKPGGRLALFEYTLAPDEEFTAREQELLEVVIRGSAMHGLRDFRHGLFGEKLADAGFTAVADENISPHIRPSFRRLHRYSLLPYQLVRLFGQQLRYPSCTAAYELWPLSEQDKIRFYIFTAQKPSTHGLEVETASA